MFRAGEASDRALRRIAALGAALLLAACAGDRLAEPLPAPQSTGAAGSVLAAGPGFASLRVVAEDAAAALRGFVESCPRLIQRVDASGLTRPADWELSCSAAARWPSSAAGEFFAEHFETVSIDGGSGFLTGYFEPQIAGVRNRQPDFDVPVYAMPPDLVRQPGFVGEGRAPLGRIDERGQFVPFFTRAQIVAGALDGRAPVIGWARDAIDFFFLQIQGSGQLVAPDGSVLRIGYAGQNGHGYTAIGRVLRARGVFAPGEATMQGIEDWLRANPEQGRAVMDENESWVFFRELTGDGPFGALGVPVRARASVAADPRFVPLGAPVWIDASSDVADGLWIAQDTGGAIKGANRLDTFWGAGAAAKATAGAMSSDARVLLLLPKGTLRRLGRK